MKFKITPERVAECATISEYLGALNGNIGLMMLMLPKLAIDDKGNYIVDVVLDDDGDIVELKNIDEARGVLLKITPKRFKKLAEEISEAMKEIVNPPNSRDLSKP
jgi:hypothetical protein